MNKIMIQGTSSHVGKSIITAALCRIFHQDGFSVAPFKSQNMALNSYVTKLGGEMGRAQVVQAHAAGIEPDVLMNPVLLKPTGQARSQIVLLGTPVGTLDAHAYHYDYVDKVWPAVKESLGKLSDLYEILVIEGAGSPVEVNLKSRDIVNMRIATEVNAPVILVTDIDRGGSLASIVGTLALLEENERKLVKGIIFNKFRGDIDIFMPAVRFIEEKTGVPVLGVVPYFKEFSIPDEDSVSNDEHVNQQASESQLDVCVIRLPHISNFTDFDIFEADADINLRYIKKPEDFGKPDLVIVPGTKNTIEDLLFLYESGLSDAIKGFASRGGAVIGICGGYQILGKHISDPMGMESSHSELEALGLLNIKTVFEQEKTTTLVEGHLIANHGLLASMEQCLVNGYEIHMGNTYLDGESVIRLTKKLDQPINQTDGCINKEGNVWGTYLHGIFDNDVFRNQLINNLRQMLGKPAVNEKTLNNVYQQSLNALAEHVRSSLDMQKVYQLLTFEG